MRVKFIRSEKVADNIVSFYFTANPMPRYVAGQFIELRIPHANIDQRGDKRWFTLSSSPTEKHLSLTTRLTPKTGSSFKRALQELVPGVELDMAQPMGDFVLPKDRSTPLLFVAGGIGITPFRSMVKFLADKNEKRDIRLIYALRRPQDAVFRELFEQYRAKLTLVVSSPSEDWKGESGRLTAGRIQKLAAGLTSKLVYLSGPEPMTEALFESLRSLGIAKEQVVTDYFPGYTAV